MHSFLSCYDKYLLVVHSKVYANLKRITKLNVGKSFVSQTNEDDVSVYLRFVYPIQTYKA